jgi:Cu-Zn family superoxide dismutase
MNRLSRKKHQLSAVAVFNTPEVKGEVLICKKDKSHVTLKATFTKLPKGNHGFHIHKAGDLRGEGCKGLCEHYDKGKHDHGSYHSTVRHIGDLGNILAKKNFLGKSSAKKNFLGKSSAKSSAKIKCKKTYTIKSTVHDLLGRSFVVHEDEDDLGKGGFPDSKVTGHSGARIACALIGRAM